MTRLETVASPPRRRWLARSVGLGLLAVFGAIVYPVVRFLKPKASGAASAREVLAPYKVNDLKADAEGHWPPPFDFGGKPCLLVKMSDGRVRAFNAVCTHVECTVEYRCAKRDIFCNCHNGVYDLNGRNVSGPPPRPLEEYNVELRGKFGEEEILVSRRA